MSLYLCIAALLAVQARGAAHGGKTCEVAEKGSTKAQWTMGNPYDPITAAVGDKLVFNFNAYHDVQKMKDSSCGTTGNTEVANNKVGGGAATGLTNKFTYTVTAADLTAKIVYFACSYGGGSYKHCTGGQKLTVNVVAAGTTAAPARVGACFTAKPVAAKPGGTTAAPAKKAAATAAPVAAGASRIGSGIAVVGAAMLAFFM